MPIDKSKLEQFLNNLPILMDEKKMWYRLGFYIYPNPNAKSLQGEPKTQIVDALAQAQLLSPTSALNIRISIIDWWEGEKLKPRAAEVNKPVPVGPYDELETERG